MVWESRNGPRRVLRWIWIYFLHWSGLLLWARRQIARSGGVIVLTLHRVLEDAELRESNSPPGMIIRRSSFEAMLDHLKKHYEILTLAEKFPPWVTTSSGPRFAITFDDGWKDTGGIAFPLAKKYGIPITVFVCPGFAGKVSPFWPETVIGAWRAAAVSPELHAKLKDFRLAATPEGHSPDKSPGSDDLESFLGWLKLLPADVRECKIQELKELMGSGLIVSRGEIDATMTWEDLKRLVNGGAHIGSHTQHHQILTRLPRLAAQAEIAESKQTIESTLDGQCALFAYPNGSWSPEVRELVVQAGHRQAYVNEVGIWTSETDPWLIPRVNIWEGSLTGPSGCFSPIVFQYTTVWRSYRAAARQSRAAHSSRAGGEMPER